MAEQVIVTADYAVKVPETLVQQQRLQLHVQA